MCQTCIHAFTEITPPTGKYPAYLSLNKRDDGTIWLTVRERGGYTVSEIEMSPEQLEHFATDVMEAINGGS